MTAKIEINHNFRPGVVSSLSKRLREDIRRAYRVAARDILRIILERGSGIPVFTGYTRAAFKDIARQYRVALNLEPSPIEKYRKFFNDRPWDAEQTVEHFEWEFGGDLAVWSLEVSAYPFVHFDASSAKLPGPYGAGKPMQLSAPWGLMEQAKQAVIPDLKSKIVRITNARVRSYIRATTRNTGTESFENNLPFEPDEESTF